MKVNRALNEEGEVPGKYILYVALRHQYFY